MTFLLRSAYLENSIFSRKTAYPSNQNCALSWASSVVFGNLKTETQRLRIRTHEPLI